MQLQLKLHFVCVVIGSGIGESDIPGSALTYVLVVSDNHDAVRIFLFLFIEFEKSIVPGCIVNEDDFQIFDAYCL